MQIDDMRVPSAVVKEGGTTRTRAPSLRNRGVRVKSQSMVVPAAPQVADPDLAAASAGCLPRLWKPAPKIGQAPSIVLSAAHAELFIELLPHATCIADTAGRILSRNQLFTEISSLPLKRAQNLVNLVGAQDMDKMFSSLAQVKEKAVNITLDMATVVSIDGAEQPYTWYMTSSPGLEYVLVSCDKSLDAMFERESNAFSDRVFSAKSTEHEDSNQPWNKFINKVRNTSRNQTYPNPYHNLT